MIDDGLVVLPEASLARHTAWRTGGTCDAFVWVHRRQSLVDVIAQCREVDWKWTLLGAGTRTVVRDGGVTGVVVRLGVDFARIDRSDPEVWEVGAGVPVPALVAAAAVDGRTGVEALSCVPGSVGASLHLDSGWGDAVEVVHYLQRGTVKSAPLDEVQGRNRIVVGCRLRLATADPAVVQRKTERALAPGKGPLPSSWYEPPQRGRLREVLRSVELPRVRLRRVAVAAAAPEVLLNLGEGTAADLALLHRSALERVKKTRGVELESRVRWLGARST